MPRLLFIIFIHSFYLQPAFPHRKSPIITEDHQRLSLKIINLSAGTLFAVQADNAPKNYAVNETSVITAAPLAEYCSYPIVSF